MSKSEQKSSSADVYGSDSATDNNNIISREKKSLDVPTPIWEVGYAATTLIVDAYYVFKGILEIITTTDNEGNALVRNLIYIILLLISSWMLGDLVPGIVHWACDNYGTANTPIFGPAIASFRRHHVIPREITYFRFWKFMYLSCRETPYGIVTSFLVDYCTGPFTTIFWTNFFLWTKLSFVTHRWSHMTKKEIPALIRWLQSIGLLMDPKNHARHHISPHGVNYCITSGILNDGLDKIGFWRRLEYIIYILSGGIESQIWKDDPKLRERTLKGEYGLVN